MVDLTSFLMMMNHNYSTNSDFYQLIEKYNIAGPRYTSYPTALQFSEQFDRPRFSKEISQKRNFLPANYSLYFHLPFCRSLCWYCGCTKIITRDQKQADEYLDYIEKEIRLIAETLHQKSTIKQIHFGGGTPTFLTPDQLRRLGTMIRTHFPLDGKLEFSVEIDPRHCTKEHISALSEIGCNRASLGVQDVNPDVQEAIHRIQPFDQTKTVTEQLREKGIEKINFDLIYGLPKQTLDGFKKSLEDVLTLSPDRLAVYSYAHIPSKMPAQKLLNPENFPSADEKVNIMLFAGDFLQQNGYEFIGMDHFAKKDDELSRALSDGTLQRNFQGYSTHSELDMIAIGLSGISQGNELYYQNEKELRQYYKRLDEGEQPIRKVLRLTQGDLIRKKIIMQIMCSGEIHYQKFLEETGVDLPDQFSSEIEQLSVFEGDGLVIKTNTGFRITQTGRLFVRNIAMVFDEYLKRATHKVAYSKTV